MQARVRRALGGRDWRTTLLSAMTFAGAVEVGIGVHLSTLGLIRVPPSTLVAVMLVWGGLSAWCWVRRRLREGEAMTVLCALAAMFTVEQVAVDDATWQWVCTLLMVVLPVAGFAFLQRSRVLGLTALVLAGEVLSVLAREPRPLMALYTLTVIGLCVVTPVAVVAVLLHRLQLAQADAARLARTDSLTGLLNRRGLAESAVDLLLRASREEQLLGALVADIDHFKRVNDRWGHATGDAVLVAVADAVRACVRQDDLAVRLGGEELAVVGSWPDREHLAAAAERLRAAADALRPPGLPPVTVSVGTASARVRTATGPDVVDLLPHLLDVADEDLYEAKRGGRNRVGAPQPA